MNELTNFLNGYVSFGKRQFEDSLMYFRAVLEDNLDDYTAWYNVGLAYLELGLHDKAIHYFDIALELNPNDEFLLNARHNTLTKYYEQNFNLRIGD
jgi:tetratricopeptide (TPR) repeat protein